MPSLSPTPPASTPSPRSSAGNLLAPPQSSPPLPANAPGNQAIPGLENTDPNPKLSTPRLSFAAAGAGDATDRDGRRPSVQFAPAQPDKKSRTSSPPLARIVHCLLVHGDAVPILILMGDPNCPLLSAKPAAFLTKYERRVSFNTFDNRDATDYSFTISTKHKDYQYNQRSRTFLCGTDDNDYSYDAIEWLIEELAEDGDEIICLRVVDKDSKFASDASLRNGTYKKEAEQLLEKIKNKNKDKEGGEKEKAIGLAIEFAVGKVPEVFQRMNISGKPHLST
ncbi:MAG: hypothetical protein Q9196_004856 [Gyalolechia fulgens]